jgi:hypothetical protein
VFWRVFFFVYLVLWCGGVALAVVRHPPNPGLFAAQTLFQTLGMLALWTYAFPRPVLRSPLFWKIWLHLDVALTVVSMALVAQAVWALPLPTPFKIGGLIGGALVSLVILPTLIAVYRLAYGQTLEEARATQFSVPTAFVTG